MWGPLTIIDTGRELRVAPIADPDDWIASFAKEPGFPAHEWAARMITLYNAAPLRTRIVAGEAYTPRPVTGFHPDEHDSADYCPPILAAGPPARPV